MKRFTLYTIFCLNFFAFYNVHGAAAPTSELINSHEEKTFKAFVDRVEQQCSLANSALLTNSPRFIQNMAEYFGSLKKGRPVELIDAHILIRFNENPEIRNRYIAQLLQNSERHARVETIKNTYKEQGLKHLDRIVHAYNLTNFYQLPETTTKEALLAAIPTLAESDYFTAVTFGLYCFYLLDPQAAA
jgi:hypothetical protein